MHKPPRFYPLLLLVFWTGLVVAADYVVIDTSVRQALSVNFPYTTGKMVRSEMGVGAMSHRGVEIGYNYKVNGIEYTGRQYRYDDRNEAWEYSTAIDAFPRWSARKVYYNPKAPADSLLDPGLDGCDLLQVLFAMPLNIVTLLLWVAVEWSFKKLPKPAGGVRILKRPGEIRAQLPSFSPVAAALGALAIASFFAAFPVVSMSGFAPTMRTMTAIWTAVFAVTAAAFAITVKRNSSGNYDLRIDEKSRAVTLPERSGIRVTLAREEIIGICVERRATKNPSGYHFSYLPAIDHAGRDADVAKIKLVRWGWTEAKARAFAQWLSDQLGVEFKGIQSDPLA
jgi:hypothetical protein